MEQRFVGIYGMCGQPPGVPFAGVDLAGAPLAVKLFHRVTRTG